MSPKQETFDWRVVAPVDTSRSELSLRGPSKREFETLVLTGATRPLLDAYKRRIERAVRGYFSNAETRDRRARWRGRR